jgi:segregation and condensation protein B
MDNDITQDNKIPADQSKTQESIQISPISTEAKTSEIEQSIDTTTSPRASLKLIIEALLFAENNPITLSRLAEISTGISEDILKSIEELNKEYETSNRSFRIEKVANGFQLYTLPEYSHWVRNLYKSSYHRLSRPALETLAIIIYNQPVTRPEIEKLRGVDCSGPLLTLLERKLVRIEGRAKKPGGPFLYGTGKEFLRYFGLASLNDLPSKDELQAFLLRQGETQ